MKAIVKLTDKINLEIEERDEIETLHKAIVLTNPKTYCNICKLNKGIKFVSNKDIEGNTYINIKCMGCGASSKLGRYKTSGYFWHDFEQYIKKDVKNEVKPF